MSKDEKPTLDEILEFYRRPKATVYQDMWDRHVAECDRGCAEGQHCHYGIYLRRKLAKVQQREDGE